VTPPRRQRAPAPQRRGGSSAPVSRGLGAWATGLALALVLAAAAWLHAGGLRAGFVADDYLFLDQVRARSLVAALTAPDPIGNFLRPVGRGLWFWTLARLGGESPRPFHLASLAVFLGLLAMLFALVRRRVGTLGATVATAFLAVSHAPDVAVRWGAGSQDLLAVALALAVLLLHGAGRRALAALALALALLSKETVALTPVIALLLDRRADERWRATARRAWPLFATAAAWAALWLATAPSRAGTASTLSFGPASVPAALAHLAQTALGLEWVAGNGPSLWPGRGALVVFALAFVSLLLAAGAFAAESVERGPRSWRLEPAALRAGLAWALLGALPVALVAPIWSAYHYLFALCGVAFALGALLSCGPVWLAVVVVLVPALVSQRTRALDEFAQTPDAWSSVSHVNAGYLARAERHTAAFASGLRAAFPTLAPRTLVVVSGLPAWSGVQAGGGPVVRWAYRDTSLSATLTSTFSRAVAGDRPLVLLTSQNGEPYTGRVLGPPELAGFAVSKLLDEALTASRDALALAEERAGATSELDYARAWVELALGDSAAARARLKAAGATLAGDARADIEAALAEVARGDTLAAIRRMGVAVGRHTLDAGAHALMADLALTRADQRPLAIIETFATVTLAPGWPDAWRRWAVLLAREGRVSEARRAVVRWFDLSGPEGERDPRMVALRAELAASEAGGERAREALRREVAGSR
jgi:hypothetical protein